MLNNKLFFKGCCNLNYKKIIFVSSYSFQRFILTLHCEKNSVYSCLINVPKTNTSGCRIWGEL